VRKWVHGNDVWAMAVVEEVPTAHTIEQNTVIQQLLQQYQDVFQEPSTFHHIDFMIIIFLYCQGLLL